MLAALILGYNLNNEIGFIARIPNRIKIIKYTSVVIGVVCVFWIGSLIDILHAKGINDDRAVVNSFSSAADFVYGHNDFIPQIAGTVRFNNTGTPPTNPEFLERINYCKAGNNKNHSGCTYSGFPETIVYKRINDTAFSLCGEIKTSVSVKLASNRIDRYEHKLIDWDNDTACFELAYPISQN